MARQGKQGKMYAPDGTCVWLEWRWTVSKGRDTYNYNICSLYVDGHKSASCKGGGYDMEGTAFGDWVEEVYAETLETLSPSDFYGLKFYGKDADGRHVEHASYQAGDNVSLDGACGLSSMVRVAEALGFRFEWIA